MKNKILKVLKVPGLLVVLTVTLGVEQCVWNPLPLIFIPLIPLIVMDATPETAAFVRDYQARLGEPRMANRGTPLLVEYRVGPASDPNVCVNGIKYGPFTVTDNAVEGSQTVSADEPTLQLVNAGDTAMCAIITAPVNVTMNASFDKVYVDSDPCETEPAEMEGIWQGAWSCDSQPATGICGEDEGIVTFNLLQDEYSASYSDGFADYKGHVCGNRFEYSGGTDEYEESGTFILNNDGSASKTSYYEDLYGSCHGECEDPYLVRISQQSLLDHFDDSAVHDGWTLSTENTTNGTDGWTYSESGTNLTASDVIPETVHQDNGLTWSRMVLNRQLPVALGDYIVEMEISWSSEDESAMQYLHLELNSDTSLLASAGFSDSWIGTVGSQYGRVWGNQLNSQPNLELSDTANIKISRSGESTSIHWDGVEIHSGYSIGEMDNINLVFAHYPYQSGGSVSSFGSLSVDQIRIIGVAAETL